MPAVSKAQQQAAAIAKHNPSRLLKRNRGMLKMSKSELDKFASTKRSNLPKRKRSFRLSDTGAVRV